ncbi:MAG: DUF5979 domain-containing protein [Lachnospiraceae bacterium]|nr:DUF5979 domain-containing protein [Lachnospiraceae bacterium]
MMKRRVWKGSALFLALLLGFSPLAVPKVQAAVAVDTAALCSVDFSIAGEFTELKEMPGGVKINLYQVASVDAQGSYQAVAPFESVDVSALHDSGTAAEVWAQRAADAVQLKDQAEIAKTGATDTEGKASMTDLATGLYLVTADEVQSKQYTYSFTPYLLALPNNYYQTTGSDDWIYDLTGEQTLSLKPEQSPRFGDLRIDKTLINQNITMGSKATFVFQVDIETPQGKKSQQTLALTFEEIGTKNSLVKGIPAGSKVTVTEIYSGAGYTLSAASTGTQTVTIVADTETPVSFENVHDGRVVGGYGVINNFTLDDNNLYTWKQLDDITETTLQ